MDAISFTLPSTWASYLINNDASGLEEDDLTACNKWLEHNQMPMPVDCTDVGFVKWHDAYGLFPYASDCQEYVFLVND